MKKICKFFIILCMMFSLLSQSAYAGCGFFSMVWGGLGGNIDCDPIDPKDADAIAKAFWDNGTSALSKGKGDAESWDYYLDNYSCGSQCSTNTLRIRESIKKECDARCNKNAAGCQGTQNCAISEAIQECLGKCKNVDNVLMNQEKAGAQAAVDSLNETIETINKVEKIVDVVCTAATAGVVVVGGVALGAAIWGIGTVGVLAACLKGLGVAITAGITASTLRKLFDQPAFPRILGLFYAFNKGCWFCPIFDKVYDVINDLATTLYGTLRDYALSFLAIVAFGWILFHVLKFITTLHAPNVGEFLTHIFKTLGMVMLAAAFLAPNITFLTGYLIEMPTNFALGLSDSILKTSGFTGNGVVTQRAMVRDLNCPLVQSEYHEDVKVDDLCAPQNDAAKYEGKALSKRLHDDMSCLLKKVSYEMITGMAVGAAIMVESLDDGLFTLLPDFSMLFIGLVILIAYFYFFIRVPFFLLDLILRFGFVVIMLPVFVVCYPFPSTRGYAKNGWSMLLGVLVQMISLCVFICLALAIVNSVWKAKGAP